MFFFFFINKSVTGTQNIWNVQQPGLHSCLNKPVSSLGTECVCPYDSSLAFRRILFSVCAKLLKICPLQKISKCCWHIGGTKVFCAVNNVYWEGRLNNEYNWVKSNKRKNCGARRDETGQSRRTEGELNSVSRLAVAAKPFAKIRDLGAGKQA